ncbi:MAG: hypothetical protein GX774_19780 [Armatimonadetes bacterium]|jgi:hypothetical protein|nr:hypothetical protein [Armatimonadota bacterium]
MYRIELTTYGYKVTLAGSVSARALTAWVQESESLLAGQTGEFGVLFDVRQLKAIGFEEREVLRKARLLYREKGMRRSVVVGEGAALLQQLRQVAVDSRSAALERYLDALQVHDWGRHALGWLQNGIEPGSRALLPPVSRPAPRRGGIWSVWRALIGSW